MAGVTSAGLQIKTLPEILSSVNTKLSARLSALGLTVNLSEDSLFGILNGIYADECSDLWEGMQGVYDAAYPQTSTGLNLDNVADLNGVTRLGASKSTGFVQFTGDVSTVVPTNTFLTVLNSTERFVTTSAVTLVDTAFSKVVFSVNTVSNSASYTVTIGGTLVTYNSDASATVAEIVLGLKDAVNTAALGVTATENGTLLTIVVDVLNSTKSLAYDSKLTVDAISNIAPIESENLGAIVGLAGTINSLLIPQIGIDSVTNLADAQIGREEETDAELRQRRFESVQIAGAGTVGAIAARLRQIEGVTSAFVIENTSLATDADGRPGKSFEAVVEGGVNQEIGQAVWDYKPAGIESFGNTSVIAQDTDGNNHTVYFSRATTKYIHVQVNYSLYNEEVFPATGETAIKQAVVDFGNALDIGEDIIIQRFFGPIYSTVPGISNLSIQMAVSNDGITPGPYSSANISIGKVQVTNFAISRVSTTLV